MTPLADDVTRCSVHLEQAVVQLAGLSGSVASIPLLNRHKGPSRVDWLALAGTGSSGRAACGSRRVHSAAAFRLDLGSNITLGGDLKVSVCSSLYNGAVLSVGVGCPARSRGFTCQAHSVSSRASRRCGSGFVTVLWLKAKRARLFVEVGTAFEWASLSNVAWLYEEPPQALVAGGPPGSS